MFLFDHAIDRMAQEHKKNGSRLFQKYAESALEMIDNYNRYLNEYPNMEFLETLES